MVQLFMKIPGDSGNCPEWTIVELQGDLDTKSQAASLSGKFIGDLHFTHKNQPVLIIGHHILQGKTVKLEKPIAVVTKSNRNSESDHDDSMDTTQTAETHSLTLEENIHFSVKAIVKEKMVFKTRPKPIIAHVPKKI